MRHLFISHGLGGIDLVVDSQSTKKRVQIQKELSTGPDPSANPYLAFSAIVAAGLDGINRKIEPGNPVSEDIYKMSDSRRKDLGIGVLPGSLEALSSLKSDSKYLNLCFHHDLISQYSDLKNKEIAEIGNDESVINQFMFYYDV